MLTIYDNILRKIIGTAFNEELHIMANLITKIIDFEESAAQGRFVVKPNVDADLDQRKRTFNGLPDFMTKVAKEEMTKLSSHVRECNVLYLPQLGYLLAVPGTDDLSKIGYQLPGLIFMFKSNGMAHFKSEKTRELDEVLGDTQCEIADQEMAIMLKLQNSILQHYKVLMDVMHYTAELDCLLSLATSAMESNLVRPKLTSDNILQVVGSRHPLQELCCNPFVPNDILSGGEHGKMKILTGPNASGKSVYLKQVAIVVFMAHIGSFIPAESAVIGMIDRIFTRIKTMESVSIGLSTFMIDLNQVSCATLNATGRSLVILDEFGKGTQSNNGTALLCSVIEYWLKRNEECPHTFVSTHFHTIVQKNLLPQSDQLTFMTMDVLKDGEELVFLYQLQEGSVNCSHAAHIAKLAGIPDKIIKRGVEVTNLLRSGEPIRRMDSTSTEKQDKMCEGICKQFLEVNIEDKDAVREYLDWVLNTTNGQI